MHPTTPDRLTNARMAIILDAPFFGTLLMRLPMIRDDSIDTFDTNGKRIRYNEAFAQKLSDEELRFILVHEVCHCAQGHLWRCGDRDPKKWNRACDYQINLMLRHFAEEQSAPTLWQMPNDGLINAHFESMSAEEIYNRIPNEPDTGKGTGKSPSSGFGEFEAAEGTPEEQQAQATDWTIIVTQAATAARMQGTLPASIERMIGEVLKPKVSWREVLRQFIRQRARDDYSWTRPSRRYAGAGLILPSLDSRKMGRIAIAVDTSGSIGEKELAEFQAEIQCALDECRPEAIDVIYCDAAINGVQELTPGDVVNLRPLGGGGTDFRPVFDHLAGMNPPEGAKYPRHEHDDPECLIYLTDGYGSFPQSAPSYPVMWASTGKADFPFGQFVSIR